jgi:hypothetical protein
LAIVVVAAPLFAAVLRRSRQYVIWRFFTILQNSHVRKLTPR